MRPAISWVVPLLALAVLAGCVAQDAGYGELRSLVQERARADVRSWHLEENQGEMARRVRDLLARPLGPEQAVQIAMLNSADLQAALADIGVARAALLEASLPANPEVEARVGFVEHHETELGFVATESLSRLMFLPLRRGVADAELSAAKFRVAGAALALAYEVRVAFYEYQAAEQTAELTRTVLEATGASYELAQRLHEAGNITDLDLANERVFHEEARFRVADAEIAALARREALNRLLGLSGAAIEWRAQPRLADPPEEDPEEASIERRAIERSLELRELEQRHVASARRANLARAEGLLPDLRAGAAFEREDAGWEIGPVVGMEVPLFDQGQGRVGAARAEMLRVEDEYTAHAVRVRSAVRITHAELVTAARRARYYQDVLLPLRRQVVEETQRQYNAMQVGAFQLIAARQAEVESGRDYVAALGGYWRVRAALDQILAGRLVRLPTGEASMQDRTHDADDEGGR